MLLQLPLENSANWRATPWRVARVEAPGDAVVLGASLRRLGCLAPIVVRERPGEPLEVLDGSRRIAAARVAGLKYIPALHLGDLPDINAAVVVVCLHPPILEVDPLRLAALVAYLEGAEPGLVAQISAYGAADVAALLELAGDGADVGGADETQADMFATTAEEPLSQARLAVLAQGPELIPSPTSPPASVVGGGCEECGAVLSKYDKQFCPRCAFERGR